MSKLAHSCDLTMNAIDMDRALEDSEMDNTEFGRLVCQFRRARGLTQEQLAGKLGISRPSLANIETGRQNVTLSRIVDFMRALGIKRWNIEL